MHVQDPRRAGALVEVVDILGDHEQVVAEVLLEAGQRLVRRVGLDIRERPAAGVVEVLHDAGPDDVRLRGRDVLDPVAFPEPVGVAERRHPALG